VALLCFIWRLSEEESMQKGCYLMACRHWIDAVVVVVVVVVVVLALKVSLVGEEEAHATANGGCHCCLRLLFRRLGGCHCRG
jgi:hypothetical protein